MPSPEEPSGENNLSDQAIPAGWYADPDDASQLRWWDGSIWTSHYSPLPSPVVEDPVAASPSAGSKAVLPQGLLHRAASIAHGVEDKASDLLSTGSAMVSAALAARAEITDGDTPSAPPQPMPAEQKDAPARDTEVLAPTQPVPAHVPISAAGAEYTTRTVRTFRAMEDRTRAKLAGEGWEFVGRTDAPMLRSELTFRRVKKRVPRWAFVGGASVAAVAILAIVLGSVAEGHRSIPTSDSARVVAAATPTPAVETPTPSPTPIPVTHVVQDLSAMSGTDAATALRAENITTVIKSTDGSTISDTTGWSFQGQDVPAGSAVAEGSTITLTYAPPPPPPAAPVVVAPPAPAVDDHGGATAQCNDGSLSFAAHHQGACSHHGGVAVFYK